MIRTEKIKFNEHAAYLAKKLTKKSTHTYHLGCVVLDRYTIIGTGYNQVKTHPLANNEYKTLHAEVDAVRKIPPNLYNRVKTAYVCRINLLGQLANAMPCPDCQRLLKGFNVKYVWYTSKNCWNLLEL